MKEREERKALHNLIDRERSNKIERREYNREIDRVRNMKKKSRKQYKNRLVHTQILRVS